MEKRESAITKKASKRREEISIFHFFPSSSSFSKRSRSRQLFSERCVSYTQKRKKKTSFPFYFGGPRRLNRKCFERCLFFFGGGGLIYGIFLGFFSAGRSLFARGQGGGEVLKDISNVFREGERYGKAGHVRKILLFFKKKDL